MARKASKPHKDLDGKKRDEATYLPPGVWVGLSKIKPRFVEQYIEENELPWVLTISCWHRRRRVFKYKTEELRNEYGFYLKIGPCKAVGCTEVSRSAPYRRF